MNLEARYLFHKLPTLQLNLKHVTVNETGGNYDENMLTAEHYIAFGPERRFESAHLR